MSEVVRQSKTRGRREFREGGRMSEARLQRAMEEAERPRQGRQASRTYKAARCMQCVGFEAWRKVRMEEAQGS